MYHSANDKLSPLTASASPPVDKQAHYRLFQKLATIYSGKDLCLRLSAFDITLTPQQIKRWLKQPSTFRSPFNESSFQQISRELTPQKPVHYDNPGFDFIDLFAGIGGIRKGFDAIGGRCVFTSEWDKEARRTYLANHYVDHNELDYFVESEVTNSRRNSSFMDIQQITLSKNSGCSEDEIAKSIHFHIPDHDVLLAGFPCQPFSLAGVSKKNSLGRAHGFACETQGTLFFDVEKIIEVKQPKFFVLENVKNLKSHDSGNTFAVIIRTLDRLGYWVADISDEGNNIEEAIKKVRKRRPEPVVLDAQHFIPQHRERIILLGVRKDISHDGLSLKDIVKTSRGKKISVKDIVEKNPLEKYTLSDKLWSYLFNYAIKHQRKGNGFGFGLVDPNLDDAVCRTLSARYYKDGSEILLNHQGLEQDYLDKARKDPEKYFDCSYKKPRRLTPKECARLMGFEKPEKFRSHDDKDFEIPVSNTRAYKQFGNSVVVPVFEAVAKLMKPYIEKAVNK